MNSIGSVLCAFFEDHLKIQKGLRAASIKNLPGYTEAVSGLGRENQASPPYQVGFN